MADLVKTMLKKTCMRTMYKYNTPFIIKYKTYLPFFKNSKKVRYAIYTLICMNIFL